MIVVVRVGITVGFNVGDRVSSGKVGALLGSLLGPMLRLGSELPDGDDVERKTRWIGLCVGMPLLATDARGLRATDGRSDLDGSADGAERGIDDLVGRNVDGVVDRNVWAAIGAPVGSMIVRGVGFFIMSVLGPSLTVGVELPEGERESAVANTPGKNTMMKMAPQ